MYWKRILSRIHSSEKVGEVHSQVNLIIYAFIYDRIFDRDHNKKCNQIFMSCKCEK